MREIESIRGMMQRIKERGLMSLRQVEYDEMASREKALMEELPGLRTNARNRVLPDVQSQMALVREERIRSELETIDAEMARVDLQKDLLDLQLREESERIQKLTGETAELSQARQDWLLLKDLTGGLREKSVQLAAQRGSSMPVSTLLEAKAPTLPVQEIPLKKIGVAGIAAFGLPFLLGVFWEWRVQRVTDSLSLESRTAAPVMGEIARLPGGFANNRSSRLFEESIDTLRSQLLLTKSTSEARTICITSGMSGEGKSSVASQLAVSIAKATGKTVLLVDADLRSPDQHELFGLPLGDGLVKVLHGVLPLESAIDRSLGDLVHVLPAGRLDANPHRLLNTGAVRNLLTQLSQQYDHVVIDTAPVLSASETLPLAAEADAVLLCVMRDVSRSDHVQRTIRRLNGAGANVVGTVFNGVPTRQYAYRYGDYRYLLEHKA
jgi:capsular exopolysaccharide synthesis family protein